MLHLWKHYCLSVLEELICMLSVLGPIYPPSWGWRHKTSIGMFKQGYYPTFCIAPLFLAGERLEALTAFSKLAFRLPRWEYVNGHMQHAHRCVVCFRAIFMATGVSSHSPLCFTIDGSDLKAAPFATLQSQVLIIFILGYLRNPLNMSVG